MTARVRRLASALALLCGGAAGCERVVASLDLERMIDQNKPEPFAACPQFADGRCTHPPPAGTVAWGAPVPSEAVANRPATTRALLERGRNRFEVHCAACHGLLGDGTSQVARFMALRKPPSLFEPRIVALPAERVYGVISDGYGLMPSYARALAPEDRWAIVAYLPVLRRAGATRLEELPPELRREAEESLR